MTWYQYIMLYYIIVITKNTLQIVNFIGFTVIFIIIILFFLLSTSTGHKHFYWEYYINVQYNVEPLTLSNIDTDCAFKN